MCKYKLAESLCSYNCRTECVTFNFWQMMLADPTVYVLSFKKLFNPKTRTRPNSHSVYILVSKARMCKYKLAESYLDTSSHLH